MTVIQHFDIHMTLNAEMKHLIELKSASLHFLSNESRCC